MSDLQLSPTYVSEDKRSEVMSKLTLWVSQAFQVTASDPADGLGRSLRDADH